MDEMKRKKRFSIMTRRGGEGGAGVEMQFP